MAANPQRFWRIGLFHPFLQIILVQFILFFRSSLCNRQRGKILNKFCSHNSSDDLCLSSVCIFLLWPGLTVSHYPGHPQDSLERGRPDHPRRRERQRLPGWFLPHHVHRGICTSAVYIFTYNLIKTLLISIFTCTALLNKRRERNINKEETGLDIQTIVWFPCIFFSLYFFLVTVIPACILLLLPTKTVSTLWYLQQYGN